MSEERRIRDPIHGFVELSGKEIDVVDTPVFQRLRRLRQLALAYLVYPGALHTRFEHSLGVCQIARLIAEALKLNADDRTLLRLAALLHDLGHGPFSHVSEDALQIYADQDKIGPLGRNTEKIHEVITGKLVWAHPDLDRESGLLPLNSDAWQSLIGFPVAAAKPHSSRTARPATECSVCKGRRGVGSFQ